MLFRSEIGGFAALGLSPQLLQALEQLGYEEPTPIQREAIPHLLRGADLLGQAATGTGKTAAFALPALELVPKGKGTAPVACQAPPSWTPHLIRVLPQSIARITGHRPGRP